MKVYEMEGIFMKRDAMTPFGILLGFTFIFLSIFFISGKEGVMGFISLSAALTVLGGIFASILVGSGGSEIATTFSVLHTLLKRKDHDMKTLIDYFLKMLRKARRDGSTLRLEDELPNMKDPFMKKGMEYVINSYETESIVKILETEIDIIERRHGRAYDILFKAGELAPAWGMVGTIIGLVLMLQTMNDPSSLGPAIAIALITTFYGVLLSNLVFLPLSNKLLLLSEKELFEKEVMIKAMLGIRENKSPMVLKEELYAMLPPELRLDFIESNEKDMKKPETKGDTK